MKTITRISAVSPEVVQHVASRMLDPMPPLMGYFSYTGENYRQLCGASAEEYVIDETIALAKKRAAVEREGMRRGVAWHRQQGEPMTTPTLMTAAEMRAHLIEKRRELEAQRAVIAAEQAAQEAERLKVWAPVQLATMLDTIKQGTSEASTSAGDRVEMQAVVDLACSLGYDAAVEMDDREDEVFYAVVKAPALEVDS